MERLRTPDDRFVGLPDFSFEPKYAEITDPTGGDALRIAYLDEGPADAKETLLLLHGEPSWSFLYRFMITPLANAGFRVIAPDLIGFGRSDKPSQRQEFTYARHVEWVRELIVDRLNLNAVTYFGQDWGSLIGLRLVAEHPERFARVAIGNGGLPTGEERIVDAFISWQEFSQSTPELPVGRIVAGGCTSGVSDEVVRGYDAPFPDESYKEGARIFPTLVPTSPTDPAHDANVAAWKVLEQWTKPFLTCFSDSDPITKGADRKFREKIPGAAGQNHVTVAGGGHFLQEDCGSELAGILINFVAANPL